MLLSVLLTMAVMWMRETNLKEAEEAKKEEEMMDSAAASDLGESD